MAPYILSSLKSSHNTSYDVRRRNKANNKGKRRIRPSTGWRWTAIRRRDKNLERLRLIRNVRLQVKASRDLEEFMRDLRLPFLAPSLLDDNISVEKRLASLCWTLECGSGLTVESPAYQEPPRYRNPHGVSSSLPVNGYYPPYDRHLNRKITHFVYYVDSTSYHDYLQIPSTWPPFDNVPWNDTSMFLYIAKTNSEEPERRHTGRFDFNQTSVNKDIWPQVAGSPILRLPMHELREDSPLYRLAFVNEAGLNQRFGRLIANVVSTGAFPSQYHQNLQWPAGMLCPNYQPLDYSCRVSPTAMGWSPELCPLLFAAQYKENDYAQAERVLACSFHPMMILLLLYYLDTRTSPEEPMPSWMVLFGVIYDEHGLSIHAHYPEVVDLPDNSSDPTRRVWGAHSHHVGRGLEDFWGWDITSRPHILGSLYRIQGHCRHVIERLKSWHGYKQACAKFMNSTTRSGSCTIQHLLSDSDSCT